jgi:hypothetical protein
MANPDCTEKVERLAELKGVYQRIADLHNREMEAILAGDFGSDEQLEKELAEARSLRASLTDALRYHVATHGC